MRRSERTQGVLARRIRARVIAGSALTFVSMLSAGGAFAEDRVVLETTEVRGNEELPKVLYVLPWRDVSGQPPAANVPPEAKSALLEPLDPVTHRRQIQIYRQLVGQTHDMENER